MTDAARALTGALVVMVSLGSGLAGPVALNRKLLELPANTWVKVADCPADPQGREVPPGRGANWVFDASAGVFVRFGGYTPTFSNGLWTFDPRTLQWLLRRPHDVTWPKDSPAGGMLPAMAYDAKRKCVWITAAMPGQRPSGDRMSFFAYDTAADRFTRAEVARRDGLLLDHTTMALVPALDALVLNPQRATEWANRDNPTRTWTFDLAKGTLAGPTREKDKPPAGTAMAYDGSAGLVVLFTSTGETWVCEPREGKWTQRRPKVSPSPRTFAAMCYDPVNKVCVLHGGIGGTKDKEGKWAYGSFSPRNSSNGMFNDTWLYDTAKDEWTEARPSASPTGPPGLAPNGKEVPLWLPFRVAMDYDSVHRVVMLADADLGVWACRVARSGDWPGKDVLADARDPGPMPKPKYHVMDGKDFLDACPPQQALDRLRGGRKLNDRLVNLADNSWLQLGGGEWPGGGEVPATFDSVNGALVKYGGCNNDAAPWMHGYGNDLWLFDPVSEAWICRRPTDPVGTARPANGCTRSYCFDSQAKVVRFYGGTAGNHLLALIPPGSKPGGMWTYDVARDVFDHLPVAGRSERAGNSMLMAYDPDRNAAMLPDRGGVTWLFDCAKGAWEERKTPASPWRGYGWQSEYSYVVYAPSIRKFVLPNWFATGRTSDKAGPGDETTQWLNKDGKFHEMKFRTWTYDPATNQWADTGASGPATKGRFGVACDSVNGLVALAGGEQPGANVWVYLPAENKWQQMNPANAPGKFPFNQMVFDPNHNVFLAGDRYAGTIWAYRFKGKAGK